jgi:asparagine synthase (glutamine-hydrolysing)
MDVSTMAHSVEARSPLLDTRLLEFAATIPIEQLTRRYRTKYLLKRLAERYVPREALYRRKRGFVMPASRWLRGELAPYAKALLSERTVEERGIFRPAAVAGMLEEHLSGQRDWGDPLWTLMVLEVWHRLFVDGSLTRECRLEAVL